MNYSFFVLPKHKKKLREEIFLRMQDEGLLNACMHAIANPNKEQWLKLTQPHKGWLLCCVQDDAHEHCVENLCGVAWLAPWRGQAWTMDFTVFRKHFKQATGMSKAALNWIFEHAPCESVLGLCAHSNAHAWRLAEQAGFKVLGNIPGACFQARRDVFEDAVLTMATKKNTNP